MPPKTAYRRKRNGNGKKRKRNYQKKGLDSVEKKQVVAIINKKAESKYFNTQYNLQGQSFKLQSTTLARQEVVVRAFALGDAQLVSGTYGTYGYDDDDTARQITAINSCRTFNTGTTEANYAANIPDGKYVSPSLCKCAWRIHRSMVDDLDADAVKDSNPYLIRMIRVRPRASKYSGSNVIPATDLFVNNYGVAYGIDSDSSEYQKNFGPFEMMTSKVNMRKYEVIQDTQFQLEPPTVSTVLNMDYITSQVCPRSQKLITTIHQQPKKLFYEGSFDSATNSQPLSPQSNELVFFHACILGTNTKSLKPQVELDCKPVSTFKDM